MITDSFDVDSSAIINPVQNADAPEVDACIVTFSHVIEEDVVKQYVRRHVWARLKMHIQLLRRKSLLCSVALVV